MYFIIDNKVYEIYLTSGMAWSLLGFCLVGCFFNFEVWVLSHLFQVSHIITMSFS